MRTPFRSLLLALLALTLATACSSRPRKTLKYRKKGCNCPSWGHAPVPLRGADRAAAFAAPPSPC